MKSVLLPLFVIMSDTLSCVNTMAGSLSLTGYGPRRTLIFDGDENKYELWEVMFLGYARLQKLYNVLVLAVDEREETTRTWRRGAIEPQTMTGVTM